MHPGRAWRYSLAALWAVCVALLTLQPGAMSPWDIASMPATCLICGSRGSADAILNVVLFTPLGIAIGGRKFGIPLALVSGLALSAAIEVTQGSLPGRHAGIADVVWNTVGAGVGALGHALVLRRLRRPLPAGGIPWALAAGAALVSSGLLLRPAPTESDYWVLLTPTLGGMPTYRGEVIRADFAGSDLVAGPLSSAGVHDALARDEWTLGATIAIAPPPEHITPILVLGDPDADPGEIAFVGALGEHLVLRQRSVAHARRFDAPDLRLENAFRGLRHGDSTHVAVDRNADGTCLSVGDRRECGLGIPASRSWGFLQYLEGPPEWARRIVDFFWLATLFVPAGFFARSRQDAIAGALVGVVALAAGALLTPFRASPLLELPALSTGVFAGFLVASWAVRATAGPHAPSAGTSTSPG